MATRWNIAVSPETDRSVRREVFERTLAEVKAANAHISQEELEAIIDEAIDWAGK